MRPFGSPLFLTAILAYSRLRLLIDEQERLGSDGDGETSQRVSVTR
jgi:hypothetical protein